jgi:hypothetical protein
MQANHGIEFFQIMAIMNMNMRNLTLEVNSLKNRLTIGDNDKVILHEELDNEKDF